MTTATLAAKHRAEIEARGIKPDLALEYGFRTMGEHIAFDYRLNGRIHNTKIRRGKGDMPWAETGKPLILWNFDSLKGDASADRSLIIVEGEYDGLACIQAGFRDVTSVPNGAPSGANEEGKARFAYLYDGDRLRPELEQFRRFILAVDGDEKGLFLRDALAARLGEDRSWWIDWPRGVKDANDMLRDHGTRALSEILSNPKRMWTDEVATLDDIPDPEKEVSFHIGFPGLEKHLRFPRSGFVTVLGPYESGKSTFLRQLIWNMSMNHGWRSAITCFEESAKWRTVNAFRKVFLGKPVADATDAEIADADNWIRYNVVFVQKRKRSLMDGARLLDRLEYAIKVYGINMAIIDPFNEIDHAWDRNTSKTEYISNFIKEFKAMADGYGIVLVCCVHPPADVMRRNSQKADKLYTLVDAADSAHFSNKSDIGLCIWRPAADGVTLMNIDKCKNTELLGKPTGIKFRFDEATERYRVEQTGCDVLSKTEREAA
jgi:twinkle protein